MRNSATLCVLVKDEAHCILEWIAYHKALGFDRIVLYDNESEPAQSELIRALGRAGEIVYRYWPRIGEQPQRTAYADALAQARTEWIGFLDSDEFLVLKQDRFLRAFLERFSPEHSAVVINWRIFGSGGQRRFAPGLVIERFTQCAAEDFDTNRHVKTIARVRAVKATHAHCCELTEGAIVDARGEPVEIKDLTFTRTPSLSLAQVNHYVIKSAEEYSWKARRGRSDLPDGHPEKYAKYTDDVFAWHDRNEEVDESALRMVGWTRWEMHRLMRIVNGLDA